MFVQAVTKQPVVVSFFADNSMQHYGGAVYTGSTKCDPGRTNHAVLATGYDMSPGEVPFWIIKVRHGDAWVGDLPFQRAAFCAACCCLGLGTLSELLRPPFACSAERHPLPPKAAPNRTAGVRTGAGTRASLPPHTPATFASPWPQMVSAPAACELVPWCVQDDVRCFCLQVESLDAPDHTHVRLIAGTPRCLRPPM